MAGGSCVLASAARAGGDVGLDRLCEGDNQVGTVLGIDQQKLVVGVAEIAGLEQDGGRPGAAQDMERGKTMGLRPELESAPPTVSPTAKRVGGSGHLGVMARPESIESTEPSPSPVVNPAFSSAAKRAASASEATSDKE